MTLNAIGIVFFIIVGCFFSRRLGCYRWQWESPLQLRLIAGRGK